MISEKIIEVSGLTKKFKSLIAVDNLNLNVYKGDVFGFLGPNGAGKSTTIRMLLSLINPTKGKINIFNKSLKKERLNILQNIGAIVEKPDFYLYLSAYKNLEILSKLSGKPASKKRIFEILELVGLKNRYRSKVKTFSHGMKQRLGIAQSLIHDPDLIILDEPTVGLDPKGMKEIRDLIIHLSRDQNKTIFLSSHILREVELIATRLIIIAEGQTKVEGSVQELLNTDKLTIKFEVDNTINAKQVIQNSNWNKFYKEIENNQVLMEMKKENISSLNEFLVSNKIQISSIIPVRSLEDYFFKMTKETDD